MAATLATLRTRVQILYDVAGSQVLSDDEWDELLMDAYRALWADVTDINKNFRAKPLRFTIRGGNDRIINADPGDTIVGNQLIMQNGAFTAADIGKVITTYWTGANVAINGTFTIATFLSATTVTVTPTPGDETLPLQGFSKLEGYVVALPSDFKDVLLIKKDPGTESERELPRYPVRIAKNSWEVSYRPEDTRIYIEPPARAAGSYEMLYVPDCPVLVNDTDTLDPELNRFQAFLPYHAANVALAREESEQAYVRQEEQERQRAVKWAAGMRSAEPDTVEDVRRTRVWRGVP